MIIPGFAGVSATLDITIDNRSVNYSSITQIDFEVDEDMHDMCTIEIKGIPARAVSEYHQAPTRVTMSNGAKYVHDFTGTIEKILPVSNTIEGTVNGSPFQSAKLVCFGASYAMRAKKSRLWEGYSVHEMATEMAKEYGFSVSAIQVRPSYPRYLQTAESDWAALVNFCHMHGLRVNLHGTHLHVYDPQLAAVRARSYHVLTTLSTSSFKVIPGKITNFKGSLGRSASDGVYENTVVSVFEDHDVQYDVSTAEIRGTTESPRFEERLGHIVDSYAEAKAIINSRLTESYDYHATVDCLGLPGCYPGGVVTVDEYRSDVDGEWYVKGVSHSIHSSAFTTTLKLAKNVEVPLSDRPVAPYRTPPPSILYKGEWAAAKEAIDVYS